MSDLSSAALPAPSFWLRVTSPYLLLIRFAVLALVLLSLSRVGLFIWQWQRVEQSGMPSWLLLQGVRADLILVGLMLVVPLLLAPFLARTSVVKIWQRFTLFWVMLMLALLVFVELSTPAFLLQYDVRPNRLYLEYLKYPQRSFFHLMAWFSTAIAGRLSWHFAAAVGRLPVFKARYQSCALLLQ